MFSECARSPLNSLNLPPSLISSIFRFGSRTEAAALLAEWIATVATPAGLVPGSARLLAGAVGAPDGRLELELRLSSIADLEAFR